MVNVQGIEFKKIKFGKILDSLDEYLPDCRVDFITLHWSAGAWNQPHKSYQIQIGDDYIYVSSTLDNWMNHQHTWRRNSNNLGISFMAGYGMSERNAGKYPVTSGMIEACAKTQAVLKQKYNLPWEDIVDHAHFATLDGYRYPDKINKGNIRWDVQFKLESGKTIYEETLNKSKWYYQKYLEK